MEILNSLPIWTLAIIIFLLRMVDVPLGTFRTISVVQGQIRLAALLGFFEVIVWVVAVSQVVVRVGQSPLLVLFYAGGYAAGNIAGILLERRLSTGVFALRIISSGRGREIMDAIRPHATVLAVLPGTSPEGSVDLIYATAPQQRVGAVISAAREIDPDLFYVTERTRGWSENLNPAVTPTGWRAVAKKK